ncbi:hypothetical protein BDP81DRAFT_430529, partial [Colletotrichum phormii]
MSASRPTRLLSLETLNKPSPPPPTCLLHMWCVVTAASLRGRPCSWSCMLGRNT